MLDDLTVVLPRLTVILAGERRQTVMDDEYPRQLESLYTWCLERIEQGVSADDLHRVLIDLDLASQGNAHTLELAGLGRHVASMLGMDLLGFTRAGAEHGHNWIGGDGQKAAIKRRCDARVVNRGKSRELLRAARVVLQERQNVASVSDLAKAQRAQERIRAYPGECFQDAMDQCKDDEVAEHLRQTWRSLPVYVQQRRKRRRYATPYPGRPPGEAEQ